MVTGLDYGGVPWNIRPCINYLWIAEITEKSITVIKMDAKNVQDMLETMKKEQEELCINCWSGTVLKYILTPLNQCWPRKRDVLRASIYRTIDGFSVYDRTYI